jgi:hypothetical protein
MGAALMKWSARRSLAVVIEIEKLICRPVARSATWGSTPNYLDTAAQGGNCTKQDVATRPLRSPTAISEVTTSYTNSVEVPVGNSEIGRSLPYFIQHPLAGQLWFPRSSSYAERSSLSLNGGPGMPGKLCN